jgi:hypothetical protein
MPPIIIPQLVKLALGALGAAAAARWLVKEARRVNDELDRVEPAAAVDAAARKAMPTLRRDPRTGDWRVM